MYLKAGPSSKLTQVHVEGAGGEGPKAHGLSSLPAEEQFAPPISGVAAPLVEFQEPDGVRQQEVDSMEFKGGLVGSLPLADGPVQVVIRPRCVGTQSLEVIPGQRVIAVLVLHSFKGTLFCVFGVQTFPSAHWQIMTFHLDQHPLGAAVIHVINRVL